MIDNKLIKDNAPTGIGEQISINHIGCFAGEDKKKRLYIKRTDKGLLAYCHHCGDKAFVKSGDARLSSWIHKPAMSAAKRIEDVMLGDLSTQGKIWLMKYHCSTAGFKGVVGKDEQVALTLLNIEGRPCGIQIRNLLPDSKPKYITKFFNDSSDVSWFLKADSKSLVITEDYLSAHRVGVDTHHSSMALLRTSITDKTLRQLYDMNFETIFVWLDADDAGMKGATKLVRSLKHYLPSEVKVFMVCPDKEPKECTPDQLKEVLTT